MLIEFHGGVLTTIVALVPLFVALTPIHFLCATGSASALQPHVQCMELFEEWRSVSKTLKRPKKMTIPLA